MRAGGGARSHFTFPAPPVLYWSACHNAARRGGALPQVPPRPAPPSLYCGLLAGLCCWPRRGRPVRVSPDGSTTGRVDCTAWSTVSSTVNCSESLTWLQVLQARVGWTSLPGSILAGRRGGAGGGRGGPAPRHLLPVSAGDQQGSGR